MNDVANCPEAVLSRAELRRQKLVDTARNLFIENGFHATGIAQIAQQSGIAVGQIYRDFSSKEEIVSALVKEDCGRFMDAATLEVAIAAGNRDGVLDWLHHFVFPGEEIGGDRMFAEIVAESSRNPRIAAIFASIHDDLRSQIQRALALLVPGGDLAESRTVLAETIMTISMGVLNHRLLRPDLEIAPLVESLQGMIEDRIESLRNGPCRS